jgi:DNA-directed RNA polymerase subunit RPC12/RpoP
MTDELKPVNCGCGGEAFTHILGNEIAKGYYIACDECGTKTKVFGYEAEAIEAWNRAMGADQFREGTKKIERTAKVSEIATRSYCGECGERLDDYDDICGEPPIKYCPNCGARLEWE